MTGDEDADADARADVMSDATPDTTDADATFDAHAIPDDDAETQQALRAVAEDVRAESSESQQVAAILYRVSDLYDPTEDTSPEEIYRNVRQIMRVKSQGGLDR
ncbi:hypothetical protein GWK26_03710 [haloarchaeon 3A1-DGR]|nr:hypothetical protein GWK26_03710 [haloarchaeon 3A1-DGR]